MRCTAKGTKDRTAATRTEKKMPFLDGLLQSTQPKTHSNPAYSPITIFFSFAPPLLSFFFFLDGQGRRFGPEFNLAQSRPMQPNAACLNNGNKKKQSYLLTRSSCSNRNMYFVPVLPTMKQWAMGTGLAVVQAPSLKRTTSICS
jgi:hypothetical protein